MNVLDILHRLGWDVISFKDGVYKIQFTTERISRTRKQLEAGEIGLEGGMETLYKQFEVVVGDVSFNGLGNLNVEFIDISDGSILDGYEHRNMNPNDLYDIF